MGCDGGVIATKRKFMRGGKTEQKGDGINVKKTQIMRMKLCAQSSTPLREPIVACELGNLYNKEELIRALLNKNLNPSFSHIRGLKDVKELRLTRNVDYEESKETNGEMQSMYICPVTMMEFNGLSQFVVIWSTGFVLSERAVREIGIGGLQAEYGPFDADDVCRLLPLTEDLPAQVSQLNARRSKSKRDKKESKKRLNVNAVEGDVEVGGTSTSDLTTNNAEIQDSNAEPKKKKKSSIPVEVSDSSHVADNSSAASGGGLSRACVTVKLVQDTVKKREENSAIFKGLFHKGHEADKHDRDLFMSVAGLRYTIS
eukprot:gene12958-27345_t